MIIYHQDQDFVLARPPGELVCPLPTLARSNVGIMRLDVASVL